MIKELKKARRMRYEQIENINKEIKIIKQSHIGILQLKSPIAEMKTSLDGFSRRFE